MFYTAPIKIEFNDDGLFIDEIKHPYSVRMLSVLDEVLLGDFHDKDDKPIYLMYRDVFKKSTLRFDITVIASRILGKEYARTYGHHHPIAEANLSYPEVYQVLFGEAKFILQKTNPDKTTDVIITNAKEGDVLIIPSNYGHVTINTSDEKPLFLSNLVSTEFQSDYSQYKRNKGPAIFYTIDDIEQNTNYLIRNLERKEAKDINKKYGFVCKDLLNDFYHNPEKFEFLNKPSLLFK